MISIIVPVYNVEKHLDKCIKGIIDQTYQNWELILINDGSSDRSGTICDEYASWDTRITVVHQPNSGVSIARNKGIDLAKGNFITFIDSDDWVDSYFLEAFINASPQKNSITYCGITSHEQNYIHQYFHYKKDKLFIHQNNERKIIEQNLFQDGGPVNKLYCANLIKENKIRFDPNLKYHEDHLFVYNALLHAKQINLIETCGYHYIYYGDWSTNSLSHIGRRDVAGLINASNKFLKILPALFKRYNISNPEYINIVSTLTGYSQLLLAIRNAYSFQKENHCNSFEILKKLRGRVLSIRNNYFPKTRKRKLFFFVLSLPLPIAHMALTLLKNKIR